MNVVKESVNKIVHEDFVSYTFLLNSNDTTNSYFENLVIEKRNDSVIALIIRYEPSEEYLNSKNLPFSGKMKIRKVKYDPNFLKLDMIECYWIDTFSRNDCTDHGWDGIYDDTCYNYGEDPWVQSRTLACTDGGSSDFGGDGDAGGSGNGESLW